MVHFPGFARTLLWIHRAVLRFCRIGFPHSEIPGSKPACGSPGLIAACHVLLRLLLPRHPPCALSSLTTKFARHTNLSACPSLQISCSLCPLLAVAPCIEHDDTSGPKNIGFTRLVVFPMLFSCQTTSDRLAPACRLGGECVRRPTLDSMSESYFRLSHPTKNEVGGADLDRTGDPLLAKQMLSQLSYSPI